MLHRRQLLAWAVATVAAIGGSASPTAAAELLVLTTGAMKPVVTDLAAQFSKATGHTVKITNDTAGGVVRRVSAGEAFDVLVLTPNGLTDLGASSRISTTARLDIAKVGIGVAVKSGQPLPDISTEAAFVETMKRARAVAYIDPEAGGSSGIYIAKLFERLGIAAEIKPKAVLVRGGLVAQRLLTGEADIGLHQISEIVVVEGAHLVGPLPPSLQLETVYSATLAAQPREPALARQFLDALAAPDAFALIRSKGLTPAR